MNYIPFAQMREALETIHSGWEGAKHLEASNDSAVSQFSGHMNAVGFLPLATCPGATHDKKGCVTDCYGRNGRSVGGAVTGRLARNTHALFRMCSRGAVRKLTDEFLLLMDRANAQYERKLARANTSEAKHLRRGSLFRWNWNGDIAHPVQASAIRRATEARPQTQCWVYLRSFHLLEYLSPPPPNLSVWLSSDPVNSRAAKAAVKKYPWARLAELERDEDAKTEDGVVCPKLRYRPGADTPVLDSPGACARCRICPSPSEKVGRVIFPVKHYICSRSPERKFVEIAGIEAL